MKNEIIFINIRVANYQGLIDGFNADSKLLLLDSSQDHGIGQITSVLSGYGDLDSMSLRQRI
jgi:hypothetical protein